MHSSDADALSWREPTKGLSNKEKVILLTGILFLFHYKLFIKRFSYFLWKLRLGLGSFTFFVDLPTFFVVGLSTNECEVKYLWHFSLNLL